MGTKGNAAWIRNATDAIAVWSAIEVAKIR